MKRTLNGLAVLSVSLLLVSLLFAQKASATRENAIRAADEGWARVFGAKDLKASLDFCADDASFMAPSAPVAVGREVIGKSFAAFFTLPDLKITWRPSKIEVARSGELGYSTGAYEMSFKDPSGKTLSDKGKYVTIWKQQPNGSWKVICDIFNSDLAAPAASP